MIYLDNNATTQLAPEVADAMARCWASGPLNPSSQHAAGRAARNQLDQALSQIGQLLGADIDSPAGDRLILTSGGTEANNLALCGIGDPAGPLVISSIEHPSVMATARNQAANGRPLRVIPVDSSGVIDLEAARELIVEQAPRPALVSVMAANNETGVIQPLEPIADWCRSVGAALHVDAVQLIGKLPFDFAQLGAAAVSLAAHKFHGPVGVGALLVRSGVEVRPQIYGGDQQLGRRGGTEPVALAVGMATALQLAVETQAETAKRVAGYRDALETGLRQQLKEVVIHGGKAPRLPSTACLSFPGVDRQTMLLALDFAGIACSSGSACASGSSQPSPVLLAMGVPPEQVDSALRFGFSRFSTTADVQQSVEIISRHYNRLSKKRMVEKVE